MLRGRLRQRGWSKGPWRYPGWVVVAVTELPDTERSNDAAAEKHEHGAGHSDDPDCAEV